MPITKMNNGFLKSFAIFFVSLQFASTYKSYIIITDINDNLRSQRSNGFDLDGESRGVLLLNGQ